MVMSGCVDAEVEIVRCVVTHSGNLAPERARSRRLEQLGRVRPHTLQNGHVAVNSKPGMISAKEAVKMFWVFDGNVINA